MGRIDGKICLVTGGAVGLGQADARALVREGGVVVLTDIDEAAGMATAGELGPSASFMQQDVRDEARWQTIVDAVVARFGGLDVLVNNAGIMHFADIETVTLDQWRTLMAVNVEGTMLGCKHAVPAMAASGGGSIINMSSTAAILGLSSLPAYSASKGAILALTRSVAIHCAEQGHDIRCNALQPASIDTPMVRSALAAVADLPEPERPHYNRPGPPDAVAEAVVYLASDDACFVNGTQLVIDNGSTIVEGLLPRR